MSLLTDLRARLVADSGISALTTRVRMGRSEQSDTLPRIILHTITSRHEHHMGAATGFVQGTIQIDCLAQYPPDAEALAEAVRQSLDGYRGAVGSTYISTMHLTDERSQETPPREGEDASGGISMVQHDYTVGWRVSVPTFS